ncbi:MAG: cytochrome c [Planctomycetes bacterium]|nr:cytochrome c [Planctomycetota bacterium]
MRNTRLLSIGLFSVAFGTGAFFSGTAVSKASNVDGMKIYLQHCKTCHGVDGNPTDLGTGLGARKFADPEWQAKTTDERIIEQINEGTPEMMMPFKEKLTPDEIKALVPVIRSFKE